MSGIFNRHISGGAGKVITVVGASFPKANEVQSLSWMSTEQSIAFGNNSSSHLQT